MSNTEIVETIAELRSILEMYKSRCDDNGCEIYKVAQDKLYKLLKLL